MKYCEFCGAQLEDHASCSCESAKQKAAGAESKIKKLLSGKSAKKIAVPAAVGVVILIAIFCVVSFMQASLDLKDYIIVDGVSGLNGAGKIEVSIDEEALFEAMVENVSSEDFDEDNFESGLLDTLKQYEAVANALECIKITASPSEGLSNGDKVKIVVSFENKEGYKFDYRFKDATITYTVSGLEDGKTIDAFSSEYIALYYDGFSGDGSVKLSIVGPYEIMQAFEYEFSKQHGLTNGEEIILSVKYDESYLESIGYLPPEKTSMKLTVSGLTQLVPSADAVSAAEKQKLLDHALAIITEDYNEDMGSYNAVSMNAPEVYNAYFLKANSFDDPYVDYFKGIMGMYSGVAVIGHYTVGTTGFINLVTDNWYMILYVNAVLDDAGNITYNEEVETYIFDAIDEADVLSWVEEEFDVMTVTRIQ